jgi:hypothetical protein
MLAAELSVSFSRSSLVRPRPGRLALWPTLYRPGAGALEHELGQLLVQAGFSARQARALGIRLGWDGNGSTTLALAGAAEGYTRERVRQLERRLEAHLRHARPSLPAVAAALELVTTAAPARRSALAVELRAAGLSRDLFDPAGVVRAAQLAGLPAEVAVDGELVLGADDGEDLDAMVAVARRLGRRGIVSSVAVARATMQSVARAERLLALSDEVAALAGGGWFLVRGRPSRLERRLRKVLAVAGAVTVPGFHAALARRPGATLPPVEAIADFIAELDWVAVDPGSGLVRSTSTLAQDDVLSGVERTVVTVLCEHGPLDLKTATALVAGAGVNEATAGIVLRYSPVVQSANDLYTTAGGEAVLAAVA